MRRFTVVIAAVAAGASTLVLSAACYVGPVETDSAALPNLPADGAAGSSSGDAVGGGGGPATGLPCDVEKVLVTRCAACHSAPLKAPMALVSYEDLVAEAKSDPTRTVAEIALGRMRSPTIPMPPKPNEAASGAEIGAIEKWVGAGYPHGVCGAAAGDGGTGPNGTADGSAPALTCTSGRTWSTGKKGTTMNPGRACISCHEAQSDDGPIVEIGGTVYPTFHEPDLCYGVDGTAGPAQVVITDAIGQTFTLPVGPTGNFAKLAGGLSVRTPFRAKVVAGGIERAMATPQTSGDCNGCHTASGANGAPGRIAAP